MTVTVSYSPLTYNCNGSTTAFSVTWPFFLSSDLVVTHITSGGVETALVLNTDYTVSGGRDSTTGLPAVGTVTTLSTYASGVKIRISRSTPKTQSTSFTTAGAFPAKTVEAMIDRVHMIAEEGAGGSPAQDVDGASLRLETSGATDYWDGESYIARGFADGTQSDDLATVGQLNEIVADTAGSGLFALAGDLASTTDAAKGAALIGFKPNRTGATGVTVRDQLESLGLRPENFSGTPRAQVAACFAAAKLANAPIYLPGNYDMVEDGLTVDWCAKITGPGKLIRSSDVLVPIINVVASGDRTVIDGPQFNYTPAGATPSSLHAAIRITACMGVRVNDTHITGKFYVGINGETNATDLSVTDNYLQGIVNRAIYTYIGGKRFACTGNIIDGYIGSTPSTDYGINANDGSTTACLEAVIAANIVRGTISHGIGVGSSCERMNVSTNVLESTSSSGVGLLVQIANGSRGRKALVSSNQVKGWNYAAYIYQSDNIHFGMNQLEGAAIGLLVTDSTGITSGLNSSHNASSSHFWFANADNFSHVVNTSNGGSATYDLITDANCDRGHIVGNQRHGSAGTYSVAGTNITQANNV